MSNIEIAADVELGRPRRPSTIPIDDDDNEQEENNNNSNNIQQPKDGSTSDDEEDDEEVSVISHIRLAASQMIRRPSLHKGIFTAVIVLLGIAASTAFLCMGIVSTRQEASERFEHESEELVHAIQLSMQEYILFGLWVHQACFKAAQRRTEVNMTDDMTAYLGLCTRQEFSDLYMHLNSLAPTFKFQSIQFLPKINHNERAALEAEARAYYQTQYPNFDYKGITNPQYNAATQELIVAPRTNATFYWPVHYVEPFASNEVAVDLDGYAVTSRADSIDKTVQTFQATLSGGIRLVQETDPHARGIILRHPGIATSSVAPVVPRALAQIVIRVPDLLARATSGIVKPKSMYLYDASSTTTAQPDFLGAVRIQIVQGETQIAFLPHTALADISYSKRSLYFQQAFTVADRTWICAIVSDSSENDSSILYVILGTTIIFCASVGLAIWFHSHMARVAKWNALRAEAEQERAKSAQRQVKRERQMNEFLSHEVRNPLSSAISALSFVSSTVKDPNEVHIPNAETRNTLEYDLRVMDASLQFINELLRNMLDVFRSARSRINIELNPTDIRQDILEPVASILFLRGTSTSAQVKVECPDDLVCQADRMRLKQIVLNLASNAVKFVKKGYIRLEAKTVNGSVEISVSDSGPGIPESKRHCLFAKFQQSLDELNQGTGVGLSVCKNLSDLMGFDIYLDDSFDSGVEGCPGARFVIRLNQPALCVDGSFRSTNQTQAVEKAPLLNSGTTDPSTPPSVPLNAPPGLPGTLSVLFVDDDTVLRRMFTRALKRTCPGWKISEASNGETALRLTETQSFDIIFMDQYMASIEKQLLGTETVRALRSRGVDSLICGLSANDLEKQFRDAGANNFLFKPFPCEKEALSLELIRLFGDCNFGIDS